uniref:Uncharacterized protein n=1 Tax=Dictyoglomus turgidum TaxID=513050 RepID=A0A7C3WSE4_9BACT
MDYYELLKKNSVEDSIEAESKLFSEFLVYKKKIKHNRPIAIRDFFGIIYDKNDLEVSKGFDKPKKITFDNLISELEVIGKRKKTGGDFSTLEFKIGNDLLCTMQGPFTLWTISWLCTSSSHWDEGIYLIFLDGDLITHVSWRLPVRDFLTIFKKGK